MRASCPAHAFELPGALLRRDAQQRSAPGWGRQRPPRSDAAALAGQSQPGRRSRYRPAEGRGRRVPQSAARHAIAGGTPRRCRAAWQPPMRRPAAVTETPARAHSQTLSSLASMGGPRAVAGRRSLALPPGGRPRDRPGLTSPSCPPVPEGGADRDRPRSRHRDPFGAPAAVQQRPIVVFEWCSTGKVRAMSGARAAAKRKAETWRRNGRAPEQQRLICSSAAPERRPSGRITTLLVPRSR